MTRAVGDRDALLADAAAALQNGGDPAVVAGLAGWLDTAPADELVLHWYALLLRAANDRGEALRALEHGGAAGTGNPGLAQLYAQLLLEAGRPAQAAFERAVALAPGNADVRLGLVSAQFAQGNGTAARDDLARMLAANPGWEAGHRQFAHLSALLGDAQGSLASVDRALAVHPDAGGLHLLAIDLLHAAERFDAMLERVDAALARFGDNAGLQLSRAIALDATGRSGQAATVFAGLGPAVESHHAIARLRHLLRVGNAPAAASELEPWLARSGAEAFWPYAALAWRLTEDPRWSWLEGQDGLYRIIDLDPHALQLDTLSSHLRGLHAGAGRFLDQSVRGGTQTDGPLLARLDPPIVNLHRVLVDAIGDHVGRLPAPDAAHPVLREGRDRPVRFAGSWSVRLEGSGFHASHHHPQGWISSALYVAVPSGLSGEDGRLVLGESPADLGLGLPPLAVIEPRPARLVLFPSFQWHGTRPFGEGERMTVAFDVARPC